MNETKPATLPARDTFRVYGLSDQAGYRAVRTGALRPLPGGRMRFAVAGIERDIGRELLPHEYQSETTTAPERTRRQNKGACHGSQAR